MRTLYEKLSETVDRRAEGRDEELGSDDESREREGEEEGYAETIQGQEYESKTDVSPLQTLQPKKEEINLVCGHVVDEYHV